jgi:hypothetical protein
MQDRVATLRIYCLDKIIKARGFIYGGNTVNGSKVQAAVGGGSWVPTVVSASILSLMISTSLQLERICRKAWPTRI